MSEALGRRSVDAGSTASYTYNALGWRIEKNVGGAYTEIVYDGSGEPIGENNRTSWTQSYVSVQGRHLAIYQNNATYFTHTNSLGSTTSVTDWTGAVVQDKLFYPWGQDWLLAGSLYEGRFAKLRHRDTETGLDPTYYRMFSSNQGRWLSPDPVRGGVGNPQTLSLYPYVANNATNRVDPKGDILADPYGPCGCGYSSDDPGFPSVLCPAPPSPTPTGQCPPGYIFYFDVGQYLECVALEAGIASGACVFAVSACIASGGNPFVCGFAVLACGYTYSRVKACADAAKHCIPGPLTALP